MDSDVERFRWPDHLILAATLALSCGVGIYYGVKERKKNTAEDFLMAGRSMHPIPVSLSLFVSWMSAITFLADPVEVYYYGGIYVMYAIGYTLAFPIIAHVFAPVYFRLRLTSLFELLQIRYNSALLRSTASVGLSIGVMSYLSVVLYAPAVALSLVTGIPVWGAIVMIGLVCMLYTTLGGMKAVIWADALQFGFMLLGLLAVCVMGTINIGGLERVWSIAVAGNRTDFSKWSPNPTQRSSFWILLVGGMFRILNPYVAGQIWVQRYCTLKSERDVKIALYLNVPIYIIFVLLTTLAGFILYASYHDCDPLTAGRIKQADQMVPLMVLDQLRMLPGIPGIFVGSLLSASLSTMSSGHSSLATLFLTDVVKPLYRRRMISRSRGEKEGRKGLTGMDERYDMSERLSTIFAKVLSAVFGLINMSVSLSLLLLTNPTLFHLSMAFINAFIAPISGLFYVAVLFPFVRTASALAGATIATVISCSLTLGGLIYGVKHTRLPTSTAHCPAPNSTLFYLDNNDYLAMNASSSAYKTGDENILDTTSMWSTSVYPDASAIEEGGWTDIFKISPVLFPVVGPMVCIIVALLLTLCSKLWTLARSRLAGSDSADLQHNRRQRSGSNEQSRVKRPQVLLSSTRHTNQDMPLSPGRSTIHHGSINGRTLEDKI